VARDPENRSAAGAAGVRSCAAFAPLVSRQFMPQIHLCFVWHMHQPFYKDLVTGEYRLPWTRLHALKDYFGMVKILEDFPTVHQTFNLAPSMLVQIEEYATGKAVDPLLECTLKPAAELTEAQQNFLVRYAFLFTQQLIQRFPRYSELYSEWRASRNHPARAARLFSTQDLADLQVLSQLAWFDEEFRARDAEVAALIAKGRKYTIEDRALTASKQIEIIGQVIPVYKEFAARGQIEISTTPFYHPILPLICDSNIAAESHPGIRLPGRFSYPEDARYQLRAAREYVRQHLGSTPVGLWPSEGSVSDEALRIASESGFEWIASDNGVLARTLNRDAGPSVTYRPYRWIQNGREISAIFRDHHLSDLIGFVYSKMDAAGAVTHFLQQIRENSRQQLALGRDVLVPIILDGENAWEYFPENGRPFLRELYRRIVGAPDLAALTVSEALRIHQQQQTSIDRIFPGSWIDANFDVWIGAEEDNVAWEYLLRAHQKYDEVAPGVPEENRKVAFEELLIAEGSDWCWWYGPEHASENRPEFDQLYRDHLSNVYRALGLLPPEDLSRPILGEMIGEIHEPPRNAIHPVIDGEATSYFEWMGAGRYRPDARSGAMHGDRGVVRDLYYGSDGINLFLRIDHASEADFAEILLRTDGKSIALIAEPAVETARKTIFEAKIPLAVLDVSATDRFKFQVELMGNLLPLAVVPTQGWIEASLNGPKN
jgi:alpha-amylase/alpha-mannosidase (GH57 family)